MNLTEALIIFDNAAADLGRDFFVESPLTISDLLLDQSSELGRPISVSEANELRALVLKARGISL